MAISLPQHIVQAIANSPKGMIPTGIKAVENTAKTLTSKRDYVSTKGPNFGNTYTKYGGVVSVLKSGPTPASVKQASAQRNAKNK